MGKPYLSMDGMETAIPNSGEASIGDLNATFVKKLKDPCPHTFSPWNVECDEDIGTGKPHSDLNHHFTTYLLRSCFMSTFHNICHIAIVSPLLCIEFVV